MVVQLISVALYTRLKDLLDGAVSCAVFKHSVPVIHSNGYIITTTVLTNYFTHLYMTQQRIVYCIVLENETGCRPTNGQLERALSTQPPALSGMVNK